MTTEERLFEDIGERLKDVEMTGDFKSARFRPGCNHSKHPIYEIFLMETEDGKTVSREIHHGPTEIRLTPSERGEMGVERYHPGSEPEFTPSQLATCEARILSRALRSTYPNPLYNTLTPRW